MNSFKTETQREWKMSIVRELHELLEKTPDRDDSSSIQKLIRYLQTILRIKQVIPPMVEIMTLIKQSKPNLYHGTRRTILQSSNLYMLFQVEMDPQLATKRLEDFISN